MKTAEIVLLLLLLVAGYRGYQKGLIREVLGLVALVAGVVVSLLFFEQGAAILSNLFNTYGSILSVFSFILIFLGTIVLISLAGKAVKEAINFTPLGYIDSLAGGLLGMLKWIFAISFVLWLLDLADIQLDFVEESNWYSRIRYFAPVAIEKLQAWFPMLDSPLHNLKQFVESLKTESS